MRSRSGDFVVQVRQVPCSAFVTCNKAVRMRYGSSVVTFDVDYKYVLVTMSGLVGAALFWRYRPCICDGSQLVLLSTMCALELVCECTCGGLAVPLCICHAWLSHLCVFCVHSCSVTADPVCIQSTTLSTAIRVFRVGQAVPRWIFTFPDGTTVRLPISHFSLSSPKCFSYRVWAAVFL